MHFDANPVCVAASQCPRAPRARDTRSTNRPTARTSLAFFCFCTTPREVPRRLDAADALRELSPRQPPKLRPERPSADTPHRLEKLVCVDTKFYKCEVAHLLIVSTPRANGGRARRFPARSCAPLSGCIGARWDEHVDCVPEDEGHRKKADNRATSALRLTTRAAAARCRERRTS
jgi:hypothetical protein